MVKVSVVLPLCNEQENIRAIVTEIKKLQPYEIIAVVNGSTDNTKRIVEDMHCKIYEYKEPLGHNVGRAIGARHATGDILLFLDGDIVIKASTLKIFIEAIEQGNDIALNQLSYFWDKVKPPHHISIAKRALNILSNYGELSINSFVAIPHAMSRNALNKIKWWNLAFPPKAQVIAMEQKLSITCPILVDVVSKNKIRKDQHQTIAKGTPYDISSSRIIGDHLQALAYLTRKKEGEGIGSPIYNNATLLPQQKNVTSGKCSVIISFQTGEMKAQLLENIMLAKINDIVVVISDSDNHEALLDKYNVKIVPVSDLLPSHLKFFIGAAFAQGEKLLFLQGTERLSISDIKKYYNALDNGVDAVLTNTDNELMKEKVSDQCALLSFLNVIGKQPDLLCSTIFTTPYAMTRKTVIELGESGYVNPFYTQLLITSNNKKIEKVSIESDIERKNEELINAGVLEAINRYLQQTDNRGGYLIGNRKMKEIEKLKSAKKLSVIIPLMNEEGTIKHVIEEVQKLNPYEIIAVVNGSTDGTASIVNDLNCKVISFEQPLGYDCGRAIGAYHAKGDVLLFVDGDITIASNELQSFVASIKNGADFAINDLRWTIERKIRPHPSAIAKKAINDLCSRDDLSVNSMVAIPHAMSKNALEKIGWWNLADPPVAFVKAIKEELLITAPESVNVINSNKFRPIHSTKDHFSPFPFPTASIIGVHLKAIKEELVHSGDRGNYIDKRNRNLVAKYTPFLWKRKVKRSAIICAETKVAYINHHIKVLKDIVDEIIVVTNGESKQINKLAEQKLCRNIVVKQPLGPFTQRSIGANYARGKVLLFIDCKTKHSKSNLLQYIQEVERSNGIALNNIEYIIDKVQPIDTFNTLQMFLNIALHQPDLVNASMYTYPLVIHKDALDIIGREPLMVPALAQVIAVLNGIPIATSCSTPLEKDVLTELKRNTHYNYRSELKKIILGDFLEGFSYLFRERGTLAQFNDGNKNRKLLEEYKKRER
ncbi:hypothetical protein CIB95_09365 [Lottiidibacillus patelloidae]|uniref:Glycosyltransferase 2-like domain-containing protein n=1 Tax=Lottiidibacillus patelloidae TaxID=2670334 RepID=A0A263BTE2_9BACI|nr:glycosyltransferase [Lottiidibacillus patelloidae]OZM56969.1 hypothetical protein CIB95_09365 [Lottiidibacillus patelloidae]